MPEKISAAAKKLRGNPSGKKQKPPLDAQGDLWTPPATFKSARLKAQWKYVVENAPVGLLAAIDRDLLASYVAAVVAHRDAVEAMFKEGLVVELSNGTPMANPLVQIAGKQAELMLKHAKQLGFTPAARSALSAAGVGNARAIEGSLVSFNDQRPAFDA